LSSIHVIAVDHEANEEIEAAFTFQQAIEQGRVPEKSLFDHSYSELIRKGNLFYGGTVAMPKTRAISGVLGTALSSVNVYSLTGNQGSIIGTLSPKDRVYVYSVSDGYAQIQFSANGTLKTGYVRSVYIYTPAYGWSKPISSGSISQYYGESYTSTSHTGTDVSASSGTIIRAVNDGTASYKITYKVESGTNTSYYADYGKFVSQTTTAGSATKTVIYAHMSSFPSLSTPNYPSTGWPDNISETKYTETLLTKSVTNGQLLGYVGTTGMSTGNHLHFEIRNSSGSTEDPFNYVVFPNVGKA